MFFSIFDVDLLFRRVSFDKLLLINIMSQSIQTVVLMCSRPTYAIQKYSLLCMDFCALFQCDDDYDDNELMLNYHANSILVTSEVSVFRGHQRWMMRWKLVLAAAITGKIPGTYGNLTLDLPPVDLNRIHSTRLPSYDKRGLHEKIFTHKYL